MNILKQTTIWPTVPALGRHLTERHSGQLVPVLCGESFGNSLAAYLAHIGSTCRLKLIIQDCYLARSSRDRAFIRRKVARSMSTSCLVLDLAWLPQEREDLQDYLHSLMPALNQADSRAEIAIFASGDLLVLQDNLNQFIRNLMPLPEIVSSLMTTPNLHPHSQGAALV